MKFYRMAKSYAIVESLYVVLDDPGLASTASSSVLSTSLSAKVIGLAL